MRLAKTLVVIAGCLWLAWLIVRTSVVSALLDENPAAAMLVAPDDPRVAIGVATAEFGLTGGRVDPATQSRSIEAVAQSPLAAEPFLLAAVDAMARGDAGAEKLLSEAKRRNPRLRMAHLLLLDRQLRAGRVQEAVTTMNVLTRLIPGARQVLISQLAQFARAKDTRPAIKEVLSKDPAMKAGLLEYLASDVKDPELILALAGDLAPAANGVPLAPWQQGLLNALVERGDTEKAYQLWARFSGVSAAQGKRDIYDPGFKGLPGSPPFNWRFEETGAGVAEIGRSSGLQVQYYGRDQATLADQLLMLTPGRYSLSARVEGNAGPEAPRLAWKITCRKSGPTLADLGLSGAGQTSGTVSSGFSVPSGCASQQLSLVGTPSEFPKDVRLTVVELALKKVG